VADLRLGVDLGDTSVDAVVFNERDQLIARAKLRNGEDGAGSLFEAVAAVSGDRSGADPKRIDRAVLCSTAALAAIERRQELRRVAVLRIGAPLTLALPPLATWPTSLRSAVSVGEVVIAGGAEYDGRAVAALDEDAVLRFLEATASAADAVAVTGLFSTVRPEQELEVAELVRRELGASTYVSVSHELGTAGLLERENATVLNAALGGVAERLAGVFGKALERCGIDAELFFAKGDGTVMSLEHAARFPVYLIGSGQASGIRGAGWLSGAVDGVMLDMGATSTRVGMLIGGHPSERATPMELAGVRTNLSIPETLTLRVGGATTISLDESPPAIGAESLGGRLEEDSLVFGGSTPTLTDAAVAGGRARLGSQGLSAQQQGSLAAVLPVLDRLLAQAVERVQHAVAAATLVVFGGASILVPDHLAGISQTTVPANGDVAGAVGLVTAPAGGQSDRICADRLSVRATTMQAAQADALARAIHAGADPAQVQIVDVEEAPLTYLLNPPIRIRVRAAGPVV
jgi:N-methylhydantoinase A/oxoprolinase/acetone carboxylase beta subunit